VVGGRWRLLVLGSALAGVLGVWSPRASAEGFDHIFSGEVNSWVCLNEGVQTGVHFHDRNCNPVSYTGSLTISVTHPKGYVEWEHEDHWWDPATETVKSLNGYRRRGAAVCCSPYGFDSSVTVQVTGQSSVMFGLLICSFGTATVTASAGGKSDEMTVYESQEWAFGRADWYSDTSQLPPGCEGPYIVAIPYATYGQNLGGASVRVAKDSYSDPIAATVSNPGPMVPLDPWYPANDQHNNHYWGSGGQCPIAVALDGKLRATRVGGVDGTDGNQFHCQIIDLDDHYEDENGHSIRDLILGEAGSGDVFWQFSD